MNHLEAQGQRIVWRHRHQTRWVAPGGADSIRVRATMNAAMPELPRRGLLVRAECGANTFMSFTDRNALAVGCIYPMMQEEAVHAGRTAASETEVLTQV